MNTATHSGSRQLRLWAISGVGPPTEDRQPPLDIVHHRDNAGDAFCGLLGFSFLSVAANKPGQRDDTVLYSHRDIGRVNVQVPPKLRFNVPFDVDVGPHAASLMPMVPRGSNVLSFRCARARLKAAPARLTIIDAVPPAGLTAVKLPR